MTTPRTGARPAEGAAGGRDRILDAATEVFAEKGFGETRVDEIAARAGVNKAMLYYHVGGKEELYAAVLTGTLDRALAALHASTEGIDDPARKLQAVLDTLARMGKEQPGFVPLVMREIASGGEHLPDEMLKRMGAVFRFVAEILEEGRRKGAFRRVDPLLTHVTLIGSVMFCIASVPVRERVARAVGFVAPTHSLEDVSSHLGRLFLEGLRNQPGTRRAR